MDKKSRKPPNKARCDCKVGADAPSDPYAHLPELPEDGAVYKTGFDLNDPIQKLMDDESFRIINFAVEQKMCPLQDLFVFTPEEGRNKGTRCFFATNAGQEAIRVAAGIIPPADFEGDEPN